MANVSPQATAPATLGSFNAAPAQDAERAVLACCASKPFAKAIAGGRPYPDPAALLAAVDATFETLSWDDIVESMNEHPRIGDRTVSGGMSAAEQSGAAAASDEVRQGLADGNLAYEQRFGHVFLICASGLSGQEMLDQLRARLENDEEAERTVVRAELTEDNPPADDEAAEPVTLSTHVLDATTGRPAAGVQVRLELGGDAGWAPASQGQTDADGRLRLSGHGGADFEPGVYRITFGTGAYFTARGCRRSTPRSRSPSR